MTPAILMVKCCRPKEKLTFRLPNKSENLLVDTYRSERAPVLTQLMRTSRLVLYGYLQKIHILITEAAAVTTPLTYADLLPCSWSHRKPLWEPKGQEENRLHSECLSHFHQGLCSV